MSREPSTPPPRLRLVRGRRPVTRPGFGWVTPAPVRDSMRRDPVVVRADAPVAAAVALMRARRIRHLPVVDDAGRLAGIVTDRDLRQAVFDPRVQAALPDVGPWLAALTVRDVMTWAVVSVRPDADLRSAARLMRERKIGALPVVDDGRVVGLLTETDLLAAFEHLLGERVTTVRPLEPPAAAGEPYEYGFPVAPPGDGPNQGTGD